jgi:hypothetical protein
MRNECLFYVNMILTCLTCAFILLSCGGCTPEQVKTGADVLAAVHPAIDGAAPATLVQPFYIYIMLIADIASSVLAALLVILKRPKDAEKSKKNGND